MDSLPVVSRHHLDGVPGTAVQKRAIRSFADAFLATDAKIWIDLDASEWRMVLVRHPEHAGFNGAIFDASRRSGATGAAIRGNGEYAGAFLACRLTVAFRHGKVLVYDVVQYFFVAAVDC